MAGSLPEPGAQRPFLQGGFDPDPDYGSGICQRAVRLTNIGGATIGELEDSVHALRCRVDHALGRVTAIKTEFVRHPMTTCPEALAVLDDLVGTSLATPLADFYAGGRARLHCTHAYDLVWWSIVHAGRAETMRRYDCDIPDHPEGREVQVSLRLDNVPALDWDVADDVVRGPALFAGQHLMKGFVGWATANLSGDALEAALVLHKGYFVSQSRKYAQKRGKLSGIALSFEGACWTYTRPQMERTEQMPSRRDFPEGVGLLSFKTP